MITFSDIYFKKVFQLLSYICNKSLAIIYVIYWSVSLFSRRGVDEVKEWGGGKKRYFSSLRVSLF